MNRVIAQAQVWNNAQYITAPIMAIHKYLDEIQVFDGAYVQMRKFANAEVPQSTDGTKEILMALAPKLKCKLRWVDCKKFWKNEIEKKTFMLKYWRSGEWRYWLNDDEIPGDNIGKVFKRVREERKALVGYVPMVEPRLKNGKFWLKDLGFKPRFLKWQKGLHWREKHYRLYNGQGVPREQWPRIVLKEMCLLHLKYLRPKERVRAQLAYEALDL